MLLEELVAVGLHRLSLLNISLGRIVDRFGVITSLTKCLTFSMRTICLPIYSLLRELNQINLSVCRKLSGSFHFLPLKFADKILNHAHFA